MRKTVKDIIISHLRWCLDELTFKESIYNIEDYEYLYRMIFNIKMKMESLDEEEALVYYRREMESGRIRDLLRKNNIELII